MVATQENAIGRGRGRPARGGGKGERGEETLYIGIHE